MDISKSTVSVTSYNAHNINDVTNYVTKIPPGIPLMADTDPAYVERLDEYPVDARTHLKERTIPLMVYTVAGTADTLKQWFNEGKLTQKKLIVTDSTDSSTWYVYAKLKSFNKRRGGTNIYDIVLSVADSIWRKNTTTTVSWTVSTSGQTQNITVAGIEYARPIITVTPKTARSSGGYLYKAPVFLYNQTDRAFVRYPYNITNGNYNHFALVSAKSLASGDDWRVFVDGAEVERWAGGGGFNTTTLRPFINIDLQPKIELTLLTAIASSGAVTEITFQNTTANINALQRLVRVGNKALYIGSEKFIFTTVVISGGVKVMGCTRAQDGTSMAAHSTGDAVRWLEHNIWIVYGLSTASAPTLTTANQPLLTLATSTNTSWVYADFFSAANPGRPGSWLKSIVSSVNQRAPDASQRSGHYGANQGTNLDFSTIASEMGMQIKAWKYIAWRAEVAELEWRLTIPSGITTVTASGEKYRYSTSWPAAVGLQVTPNGKYWTTIWTDATPSAAITWEALAAHSAIALGATYQIIRFVMAGTVAGTDSNSAKVEYDGITLALDSNTTPVAVVGAEQSEYHVAVRIKNDTSGDYIDLSIPAAINYAITINCDNKTVTGASGENMRSGLTYGPQNVRQNWLTLDPTLGTNVISVTETGLVSVDMSFAYEARSL